MFKKVYGQFNLRRQNIASNHSFLLMQYNVFSDENVGQRQIQNTEQNDS